MGVNEARIYFAPDALKEGLVDHVGPGDDLDDFLEDRLDVDEVVMQEYQPDRELPQQLTGCVQSIVYVFGQVLVSVVTEQRGTGLQFRQDLE